MASEVKTNKISPATGTDVTLGDASDTFTIPASATLDVNGTIDITGATATGFPSSGFSKWTPVTASDATFDLQSGTTKVILEVQASGGTAGNNSGAGYDGGAGAAGAYARKLLDPMVDTDTLNITIGAVPATGGTAGTTTSVASASGTSFTTVTCTGGQSGLAAGGGSHSNGGVGGALPTTGDLNIKGQNGTAPALGSTGASSFFGVGGARDDGATGNGVAGSGYGAGGGSGRGASSTGGAGAPAIVMVWEFK